MTATSKSAGKFTILEFGDMQCPDTAAFANGMRSQILSEFVSGGKGTYRFMDFPLDSHALAPRAAEAARCAGDKADQMRSMMLQNQGALNEADLVKYAAAVGIDPQQFQQCLASGSHRGEVINDRDAGRRYGVRATPTLVLGFVSEGGAFQPAKVIRADRPHETVRADINEVLKSGS